MRLARIKWTRGAVTITEGRDKGWSQHRFLKDHNLLSVVSKDTFGINNWDGTFQYSAHPFYLVQEL